ncbi:hypothetical protein BDR04DRAFT_1029199, partial [Suillus decipiens]
STVRLWDAGTGEPVGKPLQGHTEPVNSVSFLPDGTRIVTGSQDGTVRFWDMGTRQPSQHCADLTPFFLDSDGGWVLGPKRQLLFWVPPASRHAFYNPATTLVIPRGGPELDLSRMAHGLHWQQCRDE